MTKQYPIISLNNELYMVDKEQRPKDRTRHISYHKDTGLPMLGDHYYKEDEKLYAFPCDKILASSDKSLGLPLLSNLEEWVVAIRVMEEKGLFDDKFDLKTLEFVYAFQMGYRAAGGYTEADIRKAFDSGLRAELEGTVDKNSWFKGFLSTLKPMPIAVEVEMVCGVTNPCDCSEEDVDCQCIVFKVENNFVKVIKWIYDKD